MTFNLLNDITLSFISLASPLGEAVGYLSLSTNAFADLSSSCFANLHIVFNCLGLLLLVLYAYIMWVFSADEDNLFKGDITSMVYPKVKLTYFIYIAFSVCYTLIEPSLLLQAYMTELDCFTTYSLGQNTVGYDTSFFSSCFSYFTNAFTVHCDSESKQYVPYHPTASLERGITGLNNMYNSLDKQDPLSLYLDNNCKHLLAPLVGNSPIPVEMVDPTHLMAHPHTAKLGSSMSVEYLSGFRKNAGVYVFFMENDSSLARCGSCMNFADRMKRHFSDARNCSPGDAFYSIGLDKYHWTPIHISTNYLADYATQVAVPNPAQDTILRAFAQQELRSLEQAVSSYANPSTYKGIEVNTWHNNWSVGDIAHEAKGKSVTWLTKDGELFDADSINKAAQQLGLSPLYIRQAANYTPDHFINSPTHGPVAVYIEGYPEKFGKFNSRDAFGPTPNTTVDIATLEKGKVYLFDDNMQQLPHGPYDNVSQANVAMGLPRDKDVHYAVNTMLRVKAPALGCLVYLVINKIIKPTYTRAAPQPVRVTDRSDGSITEYASAPAAMRALGITTATNSFLRTYVIKRRDIVIAGKAYFVEFVNQDYHDDFAARSAAQQSAYQAKRVRSPKK